MSPFPRCQVSTPRQPAHSMGDGPGALIRLVHAGINPQSITAGWRAKFPHILAQAEQKGKTEAEWRRRPPAAVAGGRVAG
jgi:hypothetical protein